jgi:hypothetical protein
VAGAALTARYNEFFFFLVELFAVRLGNLQQQLPVDRTQLLVQAPENLIAADCLFVKIPGVTAIKALRVRRYDRCDNSGEPGERGEERDAVHQRDPPFRYAGRRECASARGNVRLTCNQQLPEPHMRVGDSLPINHAALMPLL